MGYTTDFEGMFNLNKKLDDETHQFLTKLSDTRRMKRKLGPEFGIEGELYVDGGGMAGQAQEASIVDYNRPPCTQPSLWCDWTPTKDGMHIQWNGGEKFYCYVEWIQYIINKVLKPKGYALNGEVEWQGEDHEDMGKIVIRDNIITIKRAVITYE